MTCLCLNRFVFWLLFDISVGKTIINQIFNTITDEQNIKHLMNGLNENNRKGLKIFRNSEILLSYPNAYCAPSRLASRYVGMYDPP